MLDPPSSELGEVAAPPPPPSAGDPSGMMATHVIVPRWMIYLQGLLLCVVAVMAFLLGLLVRSHSEDRTANGSRAAPVQVSGTVQLRSGHQQQPLAGAIVMLVPADSVVDEKFPASRLIGLLERSEQLGEIQHQLRSWGGDLVRSDGQGHVVVEVSRPGDYFCLVISPEGQRPAVQDRQTWAQIGRYVVNAYQDLGHRCFSWQRCRIRQGIRLDYTLDGSG